MDVRIMSALPSSSCPENDYVRVQTYSDPGDDTVTLATIERITDRLKDGTLAKRVKPLVVRQPMSQGAALGLATSYAERKHIPVVYTESATR